MCIKFYKYFSDSGIFDAIGSIAIGGLLGALATFIVATNINFLVGRSIPQVRLDLLQQQLEDDVVVRLFYVNNSFDTKE